jgi:hypothetical protein
LARKAPPRRQDLCGEGGGGFGQADGAKVVGLLVAGGVGGHVGQDEVGLAAEKLGQALGGAVVEEVEGDERGARHRLDVEQVDADDAPALADDLRRHLRPAARGGAEIDDPLSGLQQLEALVDLDELDAARER